jgi:DNA-binding transcriptional ArsR family regulator
MDAALRALADETRRRILALVWREERPAGEIAGHFSLTRPAISQHLTVLLESKLISVRHAGTRRLYHANRDALAQLRAELGAFWDDRAGRLKAAAEKAERHRRKRR